MNAKYRAGYDAIFVRKVVHEFQSTVTVRFSDQQLRPARLALNQHHMGMKEIPLDFPHNRIPKALDDAHWFISAGREKKISVKIYSDGSVETEFC